ncbi:hypothetical protein ABZ896_36035 [Streptomyces sp. NPDC047072]|uniref:hypothetical protein n=1 Tax=Streptomyces sp. NPDC047072 TaxID=3154809 RepID=UPI0033E23A5E
MENQTPSENETPPGASEGDDVGRFAIGVIVLTSTAMTLLAELAFTVFGAGLKETAMAGASAFGGTFGVGYIVAKRSGYIGTDG